MPDSDYEAKKRRESARQLAESAKGREIGSLPAVAKPRRKSSCARNFRRFCEVYFPLTFTLRFSDDHLKVISQIEESVLRGGKFATAMPRGSGKTSLAEVACIWATLYGHREFVALIGSCKDHADQMIDSIKSELEANDLLQGDFPEAVYPIARLEGISHRCNGQTCEGKRTHIGWTADQIVLPTIQGSKASGAIIQVAGISGRIRGMKFKRPDGKSVRPDLVVVDDPQTDESARSMSQCERNERILAGAILGLAGPGRKIAGIMPCTVICQGDMADRFLDRTLHPEWNGTRTKLLYSFPTNEKLWEEYARIRQDPTRALAGDRLGAERDATEFYQANRAAMDEGAVVAWPERYDPGEISALQNAMNVKIERPAAFHAEMQNEPLSEVESRTDDLTPDQVAGRFNRLPRGLVALPCTRVTAMIDVQASLLFYVVAAWEDDFTGYVLDYGTYPEQKEPYFTLGSARTTLETEIRGAGLEGRLQAGLQRLTDALLSRQWQREDQASMKVDRCLIDANWGDSTAIVDAVCARSAYSGVLMPSHGKYVGASSVPMHEYAKKPGEKLGQNWLIPAKRPNRLARYVIYDTNSWKSFVLARLSTAVGDRGALTLFGDRSGEHRMFADHLCSEFRVRTTGRGREVDEWRHRPGRPENHFWDCLVGCAVGASIQGAGLPQTQNHAPRPVKRQKMSDLARQKRLGMHHPRF